MLFTIPRKELAADKNFSSDCQSDLEAELEEQSSMQNGLRTKLRVGYFEMNNISKLC